MFKVRPSIFETNSSSCHSISLADQVATTLDYLVLDEDGILRLPHPNGETEFGGQTEDCDLAADKLNYLYVYLETQCKGECNPTHGLDPEFYETGIKNLYTVLKEKTLCDEIVDKKQDEFWGYIDHQSLEEGTNEQDIREILSSESGIVNFVFNRKSVLPQMSGESPWL